MDKFTEADLRIANARLKLLMFYPSDPEAQGALMELLARMCPNREALTWLVDTMINRVGVWKGPTELRGVLCCKFAPADGIEAHSSVDEQICSTSAPQYLEATKPKELLE